MEKRILVVDDDERVLKSIRGVLEDEGFHVATARSGEEALRLSAQDGPDVALLDIWMPGMDGIEALRRLKRVAPRCEVIMISGHATISTAMAAVKLGAFDFIEKPLSLDALLMTVRRAFERRHDQAKALEGSRSPMEGFPLEGEPRRAHEAEEKWTAPTSGRVAEATSPSLCLQRTLKKSVVLYGRGLHSGKKTGLLLQPLPPNSGILFGNLSSDDVVPAHVDYVEATELATSVRKGMAVARTIEHLMAVFHAYRITNVMVKMIEEIPVMDGSALEFCKIIEEAGVEEQEERVEELIIEDRYEVIRDKKQLVVEPAEAFSVSYFLDYPFPVGQQSFEFVLGNEEVFKTEIAPARTFGFLKDFEMLERMGLGEGGRLHNFILIDDEKVVNTDLRFPDEFVRHKILDLIGDFYLLNRPIRGRVTARLTGHSDNYAMMRKLREAARPKEGHRGV
jgi:UDP-3-O-[3-hydroxymyristoyl] N-acetylglucosamine deacetylase